MLNLGHLYFDIVSTARCPVENFVLRISYFAKLGIFTFVESALQINSFMQNEPNFPDDQMNVNKVIIKDYEIISNWTLGENEPKTNPIKANSNPKQTQSNPISDYPCIFELAVYNLVFRVGNVMHCMPNGRNLDCRQTSFDGEYIKWQMRQEQMQ